MDLPLDFQIAASRSTFGPPFRAKQRTHALYCPPLLLLQVTYQPFSYGPSEQPVGCAVMDTSPAGIAAAAPGIPREKKAATPTAAACNVQNFFISAVPFLNRFRLPQLALVQMPA